MYVTGTSNATASPRTNRPVLPSPAMATREDLDLLDSFIRKAAHEPIKHHEVSQALMALERMAASTKCQACRNAAKLCLDCATKHALDGNPKIEQLALQRNLALQRLGLPLNATAEQIRRAPVVLPQPSGAASEEK